MVVEGTGDCADYGDFLCDDIRTKSNFGEVGLDVGSRFIVNVLEKTIKVQNRRPGSAEEEVLTETRRSQSKTWNPDCEPMGTRNTEVSGLRQISSVISAPL